MTIYQNLIAGEWVGSNATKNINPSDTNEVVGLYADGSADDTRNAIAAAKAAFPAWSRSGIWERHVILKKAGDEIMARKDELGALLAREEGKTLPEATGEVIRASQIFEFFAGEALRLAGEVLPSVRPNIGIEITREALGVIGIITPWNFPIAIPAWKIAPALCYGNTIVFKPAELVPACSWAIVDILHRAGLPKGVLNLIMGKGSVVGQAMLESPDVHGITFTGSTGTGRRVAAASIEHNRKFQLEMGGKNPMVVLDDADLNVAVEAAANSGFFSTGQRCTASSRLIVTEGIHDKFVAALTDKLKTLVVDNALKAGTHIGPVVDERQLKTDTDYIEIGRKEGAKLAFGGEVISRETPGFYLQPTLFTEATNQMRISREEIFGPVVSVIRVKDY
ncbi:MAG: aldehyde dehydrogenase family protein, partial [Rhizobium leguminosarum]